MIVGAPNAGKSSLLNALAGEERAIVTDIAGTTRDLLREQLVIDGVGFTLVDTAGLRESAEPVEREGIRRARAELARADLVLAVLDDTAPGPVPDGLPAAVPVLWLHNKADASGHPIVEQVRDDGVHLWVSARTGAGLDGLRRRLRAQAGAQPAGEGGFSARTRHLEALDRAAVQLAHAGAHLHRGDGELAAEDLRQAQDALGAITGRVDTEALLGRIFTDFCIGK